MMLLYGHTYQVFRCDGVQYIDPYQRLVLLCIVTLSRFFYAVAYDSYQVYGAMVFTLTRSLMLWCRFTLSKYLMLWCILTLSRYLMLWCILTLSRYLMLWCILTLSRSLMLWCIIKYWASF